MKFSLNWLREFVELPDDVAQLSELLTLAGVEIEGIETRGANFAQVVVAQITASAPHPNADRLSVCQVDDGSGQPRQIVCGAKNYKVGDKVPLAHPGAVLSGDLKIKASKLRGVESQGMLCSAKELAVSPRTPRDCSSSRRKRRSARPISELFPNDTILDVEITPNRSDLLSHLRPRARNRRADEEAAPAAGDCRTVRPRPGACRANQRACTSVRFIPRAGSKTSRSARARIGCAPDSRRSGLRAINNIVDITNFVMLEIGQPLHAFDADKLQGGINVRLAQPNEKFLALDGRTYQLDPKNHADCRCRPRHRDRRRDGRRGHRCDRDDAQRPARKRVFPRRQHSTHGARIESAERCQLSFRARALIRRWSCALPNAPRN